jgi:tubulin polyglutamylase TTLL5
MHIQSKLYEEWMDIMKDYSTVFCSNDPTDEIKVVNQNDSGMERSAEVYSGNPATLHYRVKSQRSEVTNIITDVMNSSTETLDSPWIQLPSGLGLGLSWNLLWTWSKPHINKAHLLVWQKINHFDDSKQLTRKDLLKKNISRFTDMKMSNKYATEFEIMPQTFLLPHEYTQFVQCFQDFEGMKTKGVTSSSQQDVINIAGNSGTATAQDNSNNVLPQQVHNYWILKPVGLSRGRGISLIKNLAEVVYSQSSVIQKYIERPLTLNSYKFDLRLFIVVTSFKPLEAFMYKDGFARLSTHAYSLNPSAINDKFIHLTNSSIQKQNKTGPSADNPLNDKEDDPDSGGSKISLLGANGLWKRLEQSSLNSGKKVSIKELWNNIMTLVVKSLVVVDEKMIFQPNAFELFGYDVLIDEDLKPWLIEVNASPSLARENALDRRIKQAMLKDLINLLDVAPYNRAALSKIIQRRLSQITKNRYLHGKADIDLEKDLTEILGSYVPRRYGELPKNMGNFDRLCPETNNYQYVLKLKKKLIKSIDDK